MLQLHGQVCLRQAAQLPQDRVGRLKAEGAPRVSLADIAQRSQRPRADGQAQAVAGLQAALAAQHPLPHAEIARILAAADAAAGDIRQIPRQARSLQLKDRLDLLLGLAQMTQGLDAVQCHREKLRVRHILLG